MEHGQSRLRIHRQDERNAVNDLTLTIPAITLACVTAIAFLHPHPLVLPFLGAALVSASVLMAAGIAWRHRGAVVTLPERLLVPGLLAFYGFVAAILCDDAAAVRALMGLADFGSIQVAAM